jgi:MFS transporter, DHA1 family, tetracycline resistance protein
MDRRFFIISLIIFTNVMGIGIILPLLPFVAQTYGADPIVIGLLMATFPFFALISGPPLGVLSDKIGRRPVLLASLAGTVIGYYLLGTARSLPILFLARMIDGASAGNRPIARAVIADITARESRVAKFGNTFAVESMGLVFGPLLGALTFQYGFTATANIAALISLICFGLTLLFLPETRNFSSQPIAIPGIGYSLRDMFRSLGNPFIRLLTGIVFLTNFLIMLMWGTLALYGNALYGFGGRELAFISMFAAAMGIITQMYLLRFLIRAVSEKTVLVIGLLVMGAALACIAASFVAPILVLGVGLAAVGFNLLMPVATGLASEITPEHAQGNLLGNVSSAAYLGALVGPVIATALFTLSMRGEYAVGAVIALGFAAYCSSAIQSKMPGR